MKLTVFFNGQFWVGVIEQTVDQQLQVIEHIFGSEPKDVEILAFVCNSLTQLLARKGPATVKVGTELLGKRINPKRLQRMVRMEASGHGVSTKAQLALQQERELRKQQRKVKSKKQLEAEKEYKRQRNREKAKAKHRGR